MCDPAPRGHEVWQEGLLQYSSKSQIVPLSFCVFFWDFGHPSAGIWPGTSLSEMAPVAGQARVGLFQYSTGSLPSAAGATGKGWLLLNSWSHRCEWVSGLCKAFQESECLAWNSKTETFSSERELCFED